MILRTAWGTHGNLGNTLRASLGLKLTTPHCYLPNLQVHINCQLPECFFFFFFFFSLPKLFPQKIRLPPLFFSLFFHNIPRAAPYGLSFLLPICQFFDLWVFEASEESFQNSNHQLNYSWNTLRANWKVFTSDFFSFVSILLWVIWIWSHLNGMGVHPWKTDEISGWNKVHSRNINYIILFHPWSVDIASEGIHLFHKKISIPF